ncbi:hypothetical protein [Streptomyces fractus]|uniref:hypothetical protein n=1 Tax=Streptomyces fractus TaxID=641806 RepID=UPI003CF95D48
MAWVGKARTDAAAHRMLVWFTAFVRAPASVEHERAYVIGFGIPAHFLPGCVELECVRKGRAALHDDS